MTMQGTTEHACRARRCQGQLRGIPWQDKGEYGGDDSAHEDVQNPGVEKLHRAMVARD